MKAPNRPHAFEIGPNPHRVVVTFKDHRIADTKEALRFEESGLPPVAYIPRHDVDMSRLSRTAHTTHCPFKGDAVYYSIVSDVGTAENAVWSYEAPYPAVAEIKDHLAFYADRVEIREHADE